MTSFELEGFDRFTATTDKAADMLNDLTAATAATGKTVAAAARGKAPRKTGALAGTIRATAGRYTATVRAGTPYGAVQHWGWPARSIAATYFASRAATGTEASWITNYTKAIDEALDQVKGK